MIEALISEPVNFLGIFSGVAIIYQSFTSSEQKIRHHIFFRRLSLVLRSWSWINTVKMSSYESLQFFDMVYGKIEAGSQLFSSGYFNDRSWSASFMIAASYLISASCAVLLYVVFHSFFGFMSIINKNVFVIMLFVLISPIVIAVFRYFGGASRYGTMLPLKEVLLDGVPRKFIFAFPFLCVLFLALMLSVVFVVYGNSSKEFPSYIAWSIALSTLCFSIVLSYHMVFKFGVLSIFPVTLYVVFFWCFRLQLFLRLQSLMGSLCCT